MQIAAIVPLLFSLCSDPSQIANGWVFVNNVEWQSPPAELQKTYVEGDGEIVVFYRSGEFGYLSATLFSDRSSGTVSVCVGCGYSTKRGTWREVGDSLVVQSHWMHQDIRPIVPPPPSAANTKTVWRITARRADGSPREVEQDGKRYVPLGPIANPEAIQLLLCGE